MHIQVIGAGGAIPVPRAFCECRVCREARQKGAPYTRSGPSLWLRDLNLLIDTPEDISVSLNRVGTPHIDSVTYSHWHPDHTAGIRVWEANFCSGTPFCWPPSIQPTTVYLPERVEKTFHENHALADKVEYLRKFRLIDVHIVPEGGAFELNGAQIRPLTLAEAYACGFYITWEADGQTRRMVICMDETCNWQPPTDLGPLDMLILPAGIFEVHPLTGERLIPLENPVLKREIKYPQSLELVRQLQAKRALFIHLGEFDAMNYDDYIEVARRQNADTHSGLPPIQFAYDSLCVEV